jgi:hypothetical protein
MKKKIIFIAMLAVLMATGASAQRKGVRNAKQQSAQLVKDYMDSLTVLRQQLDSIQHVNDSLKTESSDGRFFRLFAPLTYYHSGIHKSLTLAPEDTSLVADAIDDALIGLYLKRPELVKGYESELQAIGSLREDVNQEVKQQADLAEKVAPAPDEPEAPAPVAVVVTKPNFWKFKFDGSLQFMQNYFSDNWYKGGESNYAAVGAATFELNYNDKDRVTFDNKLETKLGFQTSRTDTVHKFKTNNDLLRLTSKLGLQAHKKWYYTLQVLAYTQFARGFKANDEFVYSDFMSPFKLNVGIGMEYKVEALNKKLTGSLNFLPLSYNFTYVDRLLLATRNGIDEGKHSRSDFGSQFTADLKWQMSDVVTWKTRFYANTTYHSALIEWENQFELKVSKYISANLFLYPRFDDSNLRDGDLGYFQFQEWSSLGLAYTF